MRIAVVLSLVFAVLAIIFAIINPLAVDVNFGFFTMEGASLPLLLISTLLLGVVIGYLAWLPARLRATRKLRSLQRSMNAPPVESQGAPMTGQTEVEDSWTGEIDETAS